MDDVTVADVKDFNPRSREGSDVFNLFHTINIWYFNPRSREGSDLGYDMRDIVERISIHAPARGATSIFTKEIYLFFFKIV